jgi:cytidylate kinase
VLADIHARDERDSHRSASPLHRPDDAILIDTSELGPEEAVAAALEAVERAAR